MPPTPVWSTFRPTSLVESFAIWSWIASSEPATSAFSTRLSGNGLAFLDALEDVLEADRGGLRRASASVFSRIARSPARWRASRSFSTDAHRLARVGNAVEAEHLDRLAGQRLLDALAQEVVHRPHAAPVGAGDERVAGAQRAALDEDGHDRAAARVEPRLDHGAARRRVGVGLQLLDLGRRAGSCRAGCRGPPWSWPRRRRRSCPRPSPRG